MKHTSVAMGIALLLTITNPLCSDADHERTNYRSAVPWINPDGLRGVAVMSAAPKRTVAWTNPDGIQGVAVRYIAAVPAPERAWINPDGHSSLSMTGLDTGHHAGYFEPKTERSNVARYNEQPTYLVSRRDVFINLLTSLLAMLVAGSTLLVARRLWPH